MKEIRKEKKDKVAATKRQAKPQPKLHVVIGEVINCPDLSERLARIYQIALKRAQESDG